LPGPQGVFHLTRIGIPSCTRCQHHQPRRQYRRGATGDAGAYSATKGAVARPETGCLSAPASAASCEPAASCCRSASVDPRVRQSRSAMCLSAAFNSGPLLTLRRKRSQRASWISSPSRPPGAGRLPVGRRMAPSTSRRCKRRPYCIRQPRGPGDKSTAQGVRVPAGMVCTALTRLGTGDGQAPAEGDSIRFEWKGSRTCTQYEPVPQLPMALGQSAT
jgi:hypothetical protein